MSHQRINRVTDKEIKLAVVANPSHLEGILPQLHFLSRTVYVLNYRVSVNQKKIIKRNALKKEPRSDTFFVIYATAIEVP